MLVGNAVRLTGNPARYLGGATAGVVNRAQYAQRGARYNFQAGEATVIAGVGIARKSSFPVGYVHPSAWQLPVGAGGMSARGRINGVGALSGILVGGMNGQAVLAGSGTLVGVGVLAVFATATVSGSGSLVGAPFATGYAVSSVGGLGDLNAAISGALAAQAAIGGEGNLAGILGGAIYAQATLAGAGDLLGAISGLATLQAALGGSGDLVGNGQAIGVMIAALSGAGDLAGTTVAPGQLVAVLQGQGNMSGSMYAVGFMQASIEACAGSLTAAAVADAVWEAIAVDHDVVGSMGGKLNDAGAGGDPWATLLEDNGVDTLTVLQGMRLILASSTGPLSGAAGTTITIRDALDHIDRIIATVDASGNRLAVALDVSD